MKSSVDLRRQYEQLKNTLNERARREWAASEALAIGRGGIARVFEGTGIARSTIGKGISELRANEGTFGLPSERSRSPGGGRRKAVDKYPELKRSLEELVESVTRGDPESPLRWVPATQLFLWIPRRRKT